MSLYQQHPKLNLITNPAGRLNLSVTSSQLFVKMRVCMTVSLWFLDSSPRSYKPHSQAQGPGDQASKPDALPHRDPGQTEPATPGGPKRLLHWAVSHHCCRSLPPLPQHSSFCRALLQEGQTEAWCPQALQPPADHHQWPGSHSGGGDHVLADEAALGPGPRLQGRLLAPSWHGSEDCLPSRLHASHEALTRRHPSHDTEHHHYDPEHHQWTHLAPLLQHLPQQWAKQHPAPPTLTLHHPGIAPPLCHGHKTSYCSSCSRDLSQSRQKQRSGA